MMARTCGRLPAGLVTPIRLSPSACTPALARSVTAPPSYSAPGSHCRGIVEARLSAIDVHPVMGRLRHLNPATTMHVHSHFFEGRDGAEPEGLSRQFALSPSGG